MRILLIAIILLIPLSVQAGEWDSVIAISAASVLHEETIKPVVQPKIEPRAFPARELPPVQIEVRRRIRIWPF